MAFLQYPDLMVGFFLEKSINQINKFRPFFGRSRTPRIFYHPQNAQNPQIKISKIRFLKMSPKMIQKGLDIDFWCKTLLKHLTNPFPAIYHHPGRHRRLQMDLNFWQKSIFWLFWGFFTFQNMACNLAESGQKYDCWPEISSLDPKNISTYRR